MQRGASISGLAEQKPKLHYIDPKMASSSGTTWAFPKVRGYL